MVHCTREKIPQARFSHVCKFVDVCFHVGAWKKQLPSFEKIFRGRQVLILPGKFLPATQNPVYNLLPVLIRNVNVHGLSSLVPLLLTLPRLCTNLGCPFRRGLWRTAFHRCLRLWLLTRIYIFKVKKGVFIRFYRCLRLWLRTKINIFRLKNGVLIGFHRCLRLWLLMALWWR